MVEAMQPTVSSCSEHITRIFSQIVFHGPSLHYEIVLVNVVRKCFVWGFVSESAVDVLLKEIRAVAQ